MRGFLFLLALLLAVTPLPSRAQGQVGGPRALTPEAFQRQGYFEILFAGAMPTLDRQGNDPATLVLRFPRQIDAAAFDALPAKLPDWIESISVGYDSALLRMKQPVAATLSPDGDGGLLTVRGTAPATTNAGIDRTRLRIDILDAEIKARSGEAPDARQDLTQLAARTDNDPDVLKALAQVEMRLGSWQAALNSYDTVLAKTPYDENTADERRRIYRQYGPYLQSSFDWIDTKGQSTQYTWTTSGRWRASANVEAGFVLDLRHANAWNLISATGRQGNMSLERARGEIFAKWDRGDGQHMRASLYDQTGYPGAAGAYTWQDGETRSTVTAALLQPYWDVINGLQDRGRVSYGEAAHQRNLLDRYPFAVSARLSQYGVSDIANAGQSIAAKLALRYPFGDLGVLRSAGYGLDMEYFHNVAQRTNATGTIYQPLPLSQRQVHSIDVAIGDSLWSDQFRYDAYAGYSIDVLNNRGPLGGASAAWTPTDRLELGARAGYSATGGVSTTGAPTPAVSAGGYVRWRF